MHGKTDQKGSAVTVGKQKFIILACTLGIEIRWDDIGLPVAHGSRLTESLDQVVAKCIAVFVIHIFYKDTDFPFCGIIDQRFLSFWGISQFDCGIQYHLSGFVTDIAGIIQSFGNGTYRNSQAVGNIFNRCHKQAPFRNTIIRH